MSEGWLVESWEGKLDSEGFDLLPKGGYLPLYLLVGGDHLFEFFQGGAAQWFNLLRKLDTCITAIKKVLC